MREGRSRRRERAKERQRRGAEGEADQRRVESREAGSVPFSRSQAPIPFGSVAVPRGDASASRLLERTRTTDEREAKE